MEAQDIWTTKTSGTSLCNASSSSFSCPINAKTKYGSVSTQFMQKGLIRVRSLKDILGKEEKDRICYRTCHDAAKIGIIVIFMINMFNEVMSYFYLVHVLRR